MAKSKPWTPGGLVYSTDPNFKPAQEEAAEEETLLPGQQRLVVKLDTKHRAGKAVTLVQHYTGNEADREALGKKLKAFCGTGGAVKDKDIIVQGDNREKIMQWLQKNGYNNTRKG